MNYRIKKKRARIHTLKEISKLNTTNEDVVIIKFPYGEMRYDELQNWFNFINNNIEHRKLIALPDILSLEKSSYREIKKWIELAKNMMLSK